MMRLPWVCESEGPQRELRCLTGAQNVQERMDPWAENETDDIYFAVVAGVVAVRVVLGLDAGFRSLLC